MYDLTIDDFPPDRLAEIVRWRNDPAVNRYLGRNEMDPPPVRTGFNEPE